MLIRALLAFLALPGLVAFVAPLLLARSEIRAGSFNPFSLVLLVPGVTLLLWCVRDFLVTGKGTLAPWDPPRLLVSSGPYRFSRNPMYVGVSLILLGWSMAFESSGLLLYALIVATAFHLRVVFGEEPWLARTHGRKWDDYVTRVPRWLFPSRKALLFSWLGLFVLLLLAGLTYEAYADARSGARVPAAGDDGGHRRTTAASGVHRPRRSDGARRSSSSRADGATRSARRRRASGWPLARGCAATTASDTDGATPRQA